VDMGWSANVLFQIEPKPSKSTAKQVYANPGPSRVGDASLVWMQLHGWRQQN